MVEWKVLKSLCNVTACNVTAVDHRRGGVDMSSYFFHIVESSILPIICQRLFHLCQAILIQLGHMV